MIDFAFRSLFGALSLLERRLTIVMFHRVLPEPDPLLPDETDRALFRLRASWLARSFNVLTLDDAVARMAAGTLPARALCITFDDGYADNAEIALPELVALGLPATFFITTRYLDGGMMWNDRVIEAVRAWPRTRIESSVPGLPVTDLAAGRAAAVETLLTHLKYLDFETREASASRLLEESASPVENLMMNPEQIRRLHTSGMEIGAHTHSHPIMNTLTSAEVTAEIMTNKTALEAIIASPVTSFAYPNGRADQDYCSAHAALLEQAGFNCAVTTMPGAVGSLARRYEIPRFSPWDRTPARYLTRLALNYLRAPAYAAPVAA